VYHEHVTSKTGDVRETLLLGHRLEVRLSADGSWSVAVDGEGIRKRQGTAYSAWAVGAAECYRLGRVFHLLPSHG
jgi:hypothetical protein